MHLIVLATKARDVNLMDTIASAAAPVMSIILASLALLAKIIKCIMIWSPRPNINDIWIFVKFGNPIQHQGTTSALLYCSQHYSRYGCFGLPEPWLPDPWQQHSDV